MSSQNFPARKIFAKDPRLDWCFEEAQGIPVLSK
jgi:hypothetical protein